MSNFPASSGIINKEVFTVYDYFKDVIMPDVRNNARVKALPIIAERANSPYFTFDYESKITEYLAQKGESTDYNKRYPLFALILNDKGTERKMVDDNGIFFEQTVNLFIIIESSGSSDYTTEYRLTNHFKAILYPLYYALLEALYKNMRYFNFVKESEKVIMHDVIDHFYATLTDGKRVNEYADAIEIKNLKILFSKNFCKTI